MNNELIKNDIHIDTNNNINAFSISANSYSYNSDNSYTNIYNSRNRNDALTMRWLDSTVEITIPASQTETYELYSNLNEHPTWSPWLKDVGYNNNTGISTWTLAYLGLSYSWHANNTIMDYPNTIQWETLDGLPNKGRVEFINMNRISSTVQTSNKVNTYVGDTNGTTTETVEGNSNKIPETKMILTISCNLPELAVKVIEKLGPRADKFIADTLLADLKRFNVRLLKDIREKRIREWRNVRDKITN